MNLEKITDKIKKLGFTAYEAKAYIALLHNNPVTRYELSKNSGVPRSAIYDIIRKLEYLGAVNATSSKPEKYVPLPPEQLFNLLERRFKEDIEEARESLQNFDTELEPGHLWNISGYKNMLHKAREMIGRARHSIYISLWHREAERLTDDINMAIDRGVRTVIFAFTPIMIKGAELYSYELSESELEKVWNHKIILVRDQKELIMGEAEYKNPRKTVWTRNKAIVDIATNHIILDITLYGIRKHIDVGETVSAMQKGGFQYLDHLITNHYSDKNNTLLNS
ncbi:MAG: hypothetical protein GF313_14580 [Caldithrix sp.]|nr:hypothetical protein [Caldithrix sp.]